MFTEDIYRDYLEEIYRKEQEMIVLMRWMLDQVTDERMRKALTWRLDQEIYNTVLVQELMKSLAPDVKMEAWGFSVKQGEELILSEIFNDQPKRL